MIGGDDALAAVFAAFADTLITYTGAGLAAPTDMLVVWSNVAGDDFQGPGNTTRTISCEIRKSMLPGRPAKADTLKRGVEIWGPNEVVDRDDVGAWQIVLERR